MFCNQEFKAEFPSKNVFIALSKTDVTLWNVKSSSQLLHLPSNECHTTFTCLSWKVKKFLNTQKNTVSEDTVKSVKKSKLLTVGTSDGDVILLNDKGKELTKFCGGHNEQVNCLSWADDDVFYSGSNDRHIVEWDINERTHKCKWKAHVIPITSLLVIPHSKRLLSAGKVIKLWDIKQKLMLKKFSDHSSNVTSLLILNNNLSASSDETFCESINDLTFLSAAHDEKTLRVWKMQDKKKKIRPSHSFTLPSSVRNVNVVAPKSVKKPTKLIAITDDDQILVFSQVINGTPTGSLVPLKTIRLLTKDACPLNILNAAFVKNVKRKSHDVLLAYGIPTQVAFLTIDLNEHDETNIIVYCSDPSKEKVSRKKKNKLRKNSELSEPADSHAKKIEQSSSQEKITVEDKVMEIDDTGNPPTVENLLARIYKETDEGVVKKTVQALNPEAVPEFLQTIASKLPSHSVQSLKSIRWLKETLEQHQSTLSQLCPSSPVWDSIDRLRDAQNQFSSVLPRLQGSLDLILHQIIQRRREESDDAAYVFEDESSDDEMECFNYDLSDSFDIWDVENTDLQETMSDESADEKKLDCDDDSDDSDNTDSDGTDDEDDARSPWSSSMPPSSGRGRVNPPPPHEDDAET